MLNKVLAKVVPIGASIGTAVADFFTASSGFGAMSTRNTTRDFTIGAFLGLVSFAGGQLFRGPEASKKLKEINLEKIEVEQGAQLLKEDLAKPISPNISPKTIYLYRSVKYIYLLSLTGLEINYFLLAYSGIKAYALSLQHGHSEGTIADINHDELIGLLAYYALPDFTFDLMGSGLQATKNLKNYFNLPKDQNHEPEIINKACSYLGVVSDSSHFQRTVVAAGSLSSAIVHTVPSITYIPWTFFYSIRENPYIIVPISISGVSVMSYITFVLFFKTLLFEGEYARKYLQRLSGNNIESSPLITQISPRLAKILHTSFSLVVGPMQVLNTAFPIAISLRAFEVSPWVAIPLSILLALLPGYSTYLSDVNKAQKRLAKIPRYTAISSMEMETIPLTEPNLLQQDVNVVTDTYGHKTVMTAFFKQDVNTVQEKDGTVAVIPAYFKQNTYGSFKFSSDSPENNSCSDSFKEDSDELETLEWI